MSIGSDSTNSPRGDLLLEDVFASIQDGISVLDPDLVIQRVNPAMERWYAGNMPLTGKKCYAAYHNRTEPCEECPTIRALRGGETERSVVPGLPGSSVEWVELFSFPMRDPATGRITGVVEFVRDITARLKAETSLRELTEMLPETVFETDSAGLITYTNTRGFELFGYTEEDMATGVSVFDLIAAEHRDRATDTFRKRMQGLDERSSEYVAVRKDRTRFPALVLADALVCDGKPVGLRGLLIDMTERKREEEERRKLLDRLRHSEKMQAIGQLAGGIAHDYNNQLAGIISCADLLAAGLSGDSEQAELVEMIRGSAQQSTELTRQLLAFARRGDYMSVAIDMHSVIENAVSLLERSIDKRFTIVRNLKAAPSTVTGDPTLLQNAILNIVLNSRDAMPDGGRILVSTRTVEIDEHWPEPLFATVTPGRYVLTRVTDHGTGMEPDVQARMFEPFFTTKGIGKGTGMGLASVYGTISSHKGGLHVESRPGKGTTLGVYLPCSRDEVDAAPASPDVSEPAGREISVLLIEDELNVRRALVLLMKRLGYAVAAEENSADGLAYYRTNWRAIDVVVLDMVLPDANGLDTLRAMRRINPDARVLISSGYSMSSDIRAALAEGATSLLKKPFRMEELTRAVNHALRASR